MPDEHSREPRVHASEWQHWRAVPAHDDAPPDPLKDWQVVKWADGEDEQMFGFSDKEEMDELAAYLNGLIAAREEAERERDTLYNLVEKLGGLHGKQLEEAVVHLLLDTSARKVKRLPDETRYTQWG